MRYIYPLLLFIILFLSRPPEAKADHCAGGELVYEWVSDSTYRFFFKFYRDCSGISEDQHVNLCYANSCNSYANIITLNKIATLPDGSPNGSPVLSGCPGYPSKCASASATIPGYKEWWYTNTITLPFRCNNWSFRVSESVRNASVNLVAVATDLAVEATLDNVTAQGNSSPYFSVKPIPYVCINHPYTYNNGAVDVDNDSLDFRIIQPLTTGPSLTNCFTPIGTIFNTSSPPYNLVNNPFQTNNTFSLNVSTGNINFIPSILGGHTIAIKVSEYRHHVLIGTVIRDIQIQVLTCSATTVNMNIPPTALVGCILTNGTVSACATKPFSFCYDVIGADPSSILLVSDNHGVLIPAATINYSPQATDSLRGCLSWTPTLNDTGLKNLNVIVKDSTCKPPGIAITQVFTIPIRISYGVSPPQVVSPAYFCVNQTPALLTATGSNLLWYTTASGGTGVPGQPTINTSFPHTTTLYVSQNPGGCESQRVPMSVTINPIPSANVLAAHDTVCQYSYDVLKDSNGNQTGVHRIWTLDSAAISGVTDTATINVNWKSPGPKTVILSTTLGSCTASDTTAIYVTEVPLASFEIAPNICLNDTVDLYPKQDNAIYHWSIDGFIITDTTYKNPMKLTWASAGSKKLSLTLENSAHCKTNFDTTVFVHELPSGKIIEDEDNLCSGGSVSLHTQKQDYYIYEWSPPIFFNQNNVAAVNAVVPYNATVFLKVTSQWNCSFYDSIYISSEVCCSLVLPDIFSPNGDGKNDKYRILTPSGKIQLQTLIITDRWGKILLNNTSPADGWDGTFKGVPQDPDTYYYYIKYTCNGIQLEKKGNFILIR